MLLKNKKFRYYYWIVLAFTQKHARLILLSFLISIISIISIVSLSPYLVSYLTTQKDSIGIVGTFDSAHVPDEILSKISNSLIFINEKGQIIPVLADTWEQVNNGREYRFHLKKNLFWNDGKKFTVADLNYSFKDVTIKRDGDYVISFILQKPLPIFPTYLTTPVIKSPLIGVAGLYKIEHSKAKYGNLTELYLTPNKSDLPIIIYKFYDNETKLINAYKLGEINQMMVSRKTVADIFAYWKNTEIQKVVDYSKLLTLFFNMNNTLLKERDVRQSILMSIDKEKLQDVGEVAAGPVPPISWAYNPNLKQYQYNPDLAQKLMRRYNEGTHSATLTLDTSYEYLDIAEQVRDDVKRLGVDVKINTAPIQQDASFEMLLAYWKVPLDPDQYYFWHSTQKTGNITNYNNVKVDKLLEDGRSTLAVGDRKKIYFNFQKLIQDDAPAYFMYYPYTYIIKRK